MLFYSTHTKGKKYLYNLYNLIKEKIKIYNNKLNKYYLIFWLNILKKGYYVLNYYLLS